MDPTLFFAQADLAGDVREERLNGRRFLVRPLKIIKPMVLHGLHANGQGELLPVDELRRCPVTAWNSVPFTLGHPYALSADGTKTYQSIGSPAMFQQFNAGKIFHATMDTDSRVSAEAWLDVEVCELAGNDGKRAIALFQSQEQSSISPAYQFTPDPTPGTFGGVAYNRIQRNIHPDHVALLLDSKGACDLKDGCGLGVNCTGQHEPAQNATAEQSLLARLALELRRMLGMHATFSDIHESARTALQQRFGSEDMHFILDIEDNPRRVIFERQGQTLALPFTVATNGMVTLDTGEPTAVQRSTNFVAANAAPSKEASVDPITTLDQLYACNEINESIKTMIRDSLAFMQAEEEKTRAAHEERLATLANNEQVTLTLDELRTLPETALEKFETMIEGLGKPLATNFQGQGNARPKLAAAGSSEHQFVPTKSTIPVAKGV